LHMQTQAGIAHQNCRIVRNTFPVSHVTIYVDINQNIK